MHFLSIPIQLLASDWVIAYATLTQNLRQKRVRLFFGVRTYINTRLDCTLYALSLHRARSTMSLFCSIFIFVSILCWLLASAAPNNTSIYFSYITSITGAGFRSGGAIPVVDLALEQINNRTDILPNYTLSYRTIRDSKVNTIQCGNALARFIIFMLVRCDCFFECFQWRFCWCQNRCSESDPTFLTLLCCGCSTATIPVAEIQNITWPSMLAPKYVWITPSWYQLWMVRWQ